MAGKRTREPLSRSTMPAGGVQNAVNGGVEVQVLSNVGTAADGATNEGHTGTSKSARTEESASKPRSGSEAYTRTALENARPPRSKSKPPIPLSRGYVNFKAVEMGKESGDGRQDCNVTLTVGSTEFTGETGKDHGHAEMDALHKIAEKFKHDPAGFIAAEKTVMCEQKPCCKNCAAMLGHLGFCAKDDKTGKTNNAMGSTEWGVSQAVLAFFEAVKEAKVDIKT